jgi:hypothetical protein
VAHTCNRSYLGGIDQEGHDMRLTLGKKPKTLSGK